ncbi:polysaccharide pyruvyl transferase family protein [Thermophilibacter sp. ZX-H3]|uniref:polysaccharide pyruvyl transferase family protein n=1 Tax=unclassified Thermophilibacter TaxID=2847308 RepID=UPI0040408184
MKVSVITRHAITNYGSLLQALGTQRAVESLGHECEIVDYIRADESPTHLEAALLKHKPSWNSSLPKRALYLALRQPESIAGWIKFASERKKFLKLSKSYRSAEELSSNPPTADVYMTGSDQVWGPTSSDEYDPSYLLSFAPDDAPKVSYAASFGKRVPSGAAEAMFQRLLSHYSEIAVREDSAVQQLSSWGIHAKQVLDPTLLLTGDDWRSFAGKAARRPPYVLVYQIHNDSRVGRYAKKAANRLGLPLIRVSVCLHQICREGRLKLLPDIREFINLIDGTQLLITDSFHGTAFAINLNTSFVEFLPDNGTELRNASILRLTGLESRIPKGDDLSLVEKTIDFGPVNKVLSLERKRSLSVMRSMIEGGQL